MKKVYEMSRTKRKRLIVPQFHFSGEQMGKFIYLTDDEYNLLKDIEIEYDEEFCKIMKKRSMFFLDYTMEYLYKVAPWLFEY